MTNEQAIAARLKALSHHLNLRGYTAEEEELVGIARACLAHVETLTQQVAELRAELKESEAEYHVANEEATEFKTCYQNCDKRAAKVEQQRDAAHAALRKYGRHETECAINAPFPQPKTGQMITINQPICTCDLDAALQPAPAQETERGR